jgi:hypothetical protein
VTTVTAPVDVLPRWPAVLTWRAHGAPRMESARLQVTERGLKAAGRVVGGDCPEHPAFSASYDLLLDGDGITRRLSMRSVVAAGERQVSLTRNAEGFWLVDHGQGPQRAEFDGALDVDVVLSPLFNALVVRRLGLRVADADTTVPVVYVTLPELGVSGEVHHYTSRAGAISVVTPLGSADLEVDEDGFVLDYPGLAVRV